MKRAFSMIAVLVLLSGCAAQTPIHSGSMTTYKVPYLTLDRELVRDKWISNKTIDPINGHTLFSWSVVNDAIDVTQPITHGMTSLISIGCTFPDRESGLLIDFSEFVNTNSSAIVHVRFDDDAPFKLWTHTRKTQVAVRINPPMDAAERGGILNGMIIAPTSAQAVWERMKTASKVAVRVNNYDNTATYTEVFDLSGIERHLIDIQRICNI